MDVAAARRVAQPGWLNVKTVLGLLLFAAAFAGGQRILTQAAETTPAVAVVRDIPQDATLGPDDVRIVDVNLPQDLLGRYAQTIEAIEGSVITRPLRAGELVPIGWVSDDPARPYERSMTIPVAPEHAVGGDLAAGDRVDVFATFDSGDVRARTIPLARGVEVLSVVTAGGLVDEEAAVGVTVSVERNLATSLAFAVRAGEVDLAKVNAAVGEEIGGPVRAEDFQ
jgi:Flp pilus assembly protein CpaB